MQPTEHGNDQMPIENQSHTETVGLIHVYVEVEGPLTWHAPGTPGYQKIPDMPRRPPPAQQVS